MFKSCTVWSVSLHCQFFWVMREALKQELKMSVHTESWMEKAILQFHEKIWAGSHKEKWWWLSYQICWSFFCFLFPLLSRQVSISRFSHRCVLFIPGFHCWKILHSLILQKHECIRQTAGFFVVELNLKYESFVFGWNSEVSPKTTEASGDQRATGINYALLWTKLTKYWWGLLRCEAVPSGFLSGH